MRSISYGRHRFPQTAIQHAVWLYVRFGLSYRDVEDPLAERGLVVSYESVRQWVAKFGPAFAARLRRRHSRASRRWHLDEMFVRIGGKRMYLWRSVDDEGEVLDLLVQSQRNQKAARKLMRKLLKRHGFAPDEIITDKLPSYAAAFREMGLLDRHRTGGRPNNRAENSHLPVRRRERATLGFRSPGSAQRFLSVHADVYNHFNLQRHLISRRTPREFRTAAFAGWRDAVQAT